MFKRPHHQIIAKLLDSLNSELLLATECYFGDGTAIVLLLNEYRESLDADFLCASASGYRTLRNVVSSHSLGELLRKPVKLLREVRTDRYGIRTFLEIDGQAIKIEIVNEGRIQINGALHPSLGLPTLCREDMFAEKLLAITDRGTDKSNLSRDIIDLAMMLKHWGAIPPNAWDKARGAYGDSVDKAFLTSLELLREPGYLSTCLGKMKMDASLEIDIAQVLAANANRFD